MFKPKDKVLFIHNRDNDIKIKETSYIEYDKIYTVIASNENYTRIAIGVHKISFYTNRFKKANTEKLKVKDLMKLIN